MSCDLKRCRPILFILSCNTTLKTLLSSVSCMKSGRLFFYSILIKFISLNYSEKPLSNLLLNK